jgi:hypothetical protein
MNAQPATTRRNQTGQGRGITAAGKTLSGGAFAERQYEAADDVALTGTLDAVTAGTLTRSPKQTWSAGVQWALNDQGNALTIYHRDLIDDRYSVPARGLSPREEWIRGALWALRDQENTITVYLEAEVAERCPVPADASWTPSADSAPDNAITSDDGAPVNKPKQPETKYALCERSMASPFSPHHVRPLTAVGKKMSGGADTVALCGAEVAWDVSDITLEEAANELEGQQHDAFRVCMKCVERARELNAAG